MCFGLSRGFLNDRLIRFYAMSNC